MDKDEALIAVLAEYGVVVGRHGNVSCPLHTDSTPSMSLERTQGLWHCHSCGKGGDVYTLIQEMQDVTFEEASSMLTITKPTGSSSELRAGGNTTMHIHDEVPKRLAPVQAGRIEHMETLLRAAEAALVGSDQGRAYVASRGLTEATVRAFRLGIATPEFGMAEGSLVIPYLGSNGLPLAIRTRCIKDHDHVGHGKYMGASGEGTRLFNARTVIDNPTAQEIHVAEGECFPEDAEVLTRKGWTTFADLAEGEEVAQWVNGTVEYVRPQRYIAKEYDGELIEFASRGFKMTVTPGHRVPYFTKSSRTGNFRTAESAVGKSNGWIPRVGILDGEGSPYTQDELALMLAISADMTVRVGGAPQNPNIPDGPKWRYQGAYVTGAVAKVRKADRLVRILDALGIEYVAGRTKDGSKMSYSFHLPTKYHAFGRMLDHSLLGQFSLAEREFLLSELMEWDGNLVPHRNQTEYSTKYEENARWVQTLAHTTGRVSTLIPRRNEIGEWIKVSILHGKSTTGWQAITATRVKYRGTVRCVTVPSGALLVRQHGYITVNGNCDAMSLAQCGLTAVAIPGANSIKPHYLTILRGFDTVYVWGDNDKAGYEFRDKLMGYISQARSVHVPDGDVNATLTARGAEGVLKLIGR